MLKKRNGFTVIELLTVIAIIGVLAAFLFPVIASSKQNAKKTQCISNMHQVWAALKSFQQNEGRYPDFIAGPMNLAGSTDLKDVSGVVNGRAVSLYPEYIKSVNILVCPVAIRNGTRREFVSHMTLNDPMHSKSRPQWSGKPESGFRATGMSGKAAYRVYPFSTYDIQIPRNVSSSQYEVHYSPVWQDPEGMELPLWVPNHPEFVRQLRWKIPPEETVVTWCSYHRELRGSREVQPGSMDLVLFLDGHVKPIPTLPLYGNDPATGNWWDVWKNAQP